MNSPNDAFRSKGPELLSDLAAHVAATLIDFLGTDKDQADQVGMELANRMAGVWGGQNIYFPMGLSYKLSQRDLEIYSKFTGNNHSDLAREYHCSLQWIYKIVKTMRAEELARRQGGLFDDA
jgi:Mor family transcriptional regulator